MEGEIPKKDEFRLISARSHAQIVQSEQLTGRDWLHELVAQSFPSDRASCGAGSVQATRRSHTTDGVVGGAWKETPRGPHQPAPAAQANSPYSRSREIRSARRCRVAALALSWKSDWARALRSWRRARRAARPRSSAARSRSSAVRILSSAARFRSSAASFAARSRDPVAS